MLAVDIGNTHVDLGLFEGDRLAVRGRIRTNAPESAESSAAFGEFAAKLDPARPVPAAVASVVPEREGAVLARLSELPVQKNAVRITSDRYNILPHRLETPHTTGIDRLLAARAARDLYWTASGEFPGGIVVIQLGSAVTVDWVDGAGTFRGGTILPGPGMWLSALSQAAQLPALECDTLHDAPLPPGASTRGAILTGLKTGLPGAISAIRDALANAAGAPVRTIITGGAAEMLLPELTRGADTTHAPDLVLHGIRIVAEEIVHA